MAQTIEGALDQNDGIGPGFDLLRLSLAVMIVFIHCFPIANGSTEVLGKVAVAAPFHPIDAEAARGFVQILKDTFLHKHNPDAHFANVLVPMFFALSGFLVTGSAFRTRSVVKFLTFRCLRIIPALFVEVSLSAIFLGSLLTSFSLSRYFTDPQFFEYFGNIIGRIRYDLPGVFLTNPSPAIVNSNLWTLPGEFYCYLIIAVLISTNILFSRKWFSVLCVVSAVAFFIFDLLFRDYFSSDIQRNTAFAVAYFFLGAVAFQWRDKIPLNKWFFAISAGVVYLNIISSPSIHEPLQYLSPLFLTYLTIYLGFLNFPRIDFLQKGDYSYGIYLYGYPIGQALVAVFEPLRGHPIYLLLAVVPTTLAFAMASWRFFEEPALSLKQYAPAKSRNSARKKQPNCL
jgi:peptidoglycan/LPS O-acetylase OafA/YrhL